MALVEIYFEICGFNGSLSQKVPDPWSKVRFEHYSHDFISQLTELFICRNIIISHYGHWLGQESKMLPPQLSQQSRLFQKMLFG